MKHILKCVFPPMLVFACFLTVSAHGPIDDIESLIKEAESGNPSAQYELGMRYRQGGSVGNNNEEAMKWFKKAAAQGNTDAMWKIAEFYLKGIGVNISHNEVINWSRKAIAQEPESPTPIDVGYINGHEVVDLGLSVKWASCNVGASSPSFYNLFDYFAWGENATKYEYSESTSRTYGVKITNSIERIAHYDAARANWGGSWRLPTNKEMEELINKCKWDWERRYFIGGYFVDGYKVTGPNGNSIFLPAAGRLYGRTVYDWGLRGGYITSTPSVDSKFSYTLSFYEGKYECIGSLRAAGWSVRPVTD